MSRKYRISIRIWKNILKPSLSYIVGALSLKEKEVLFYLYKKDKTINETAEIMKVDRRTIRRIRDRVQAEITKKMIKGDF